MGSRLRSMVGFGAALVVLAALGGCSANVSSTHGNDNLEIHDVLGHVVNVKKNPKILASGSRLIYTTAILNPENPALDIAGWPDDMKKNDPDTWRQYTDKFNSVAKVPMLGELSNNTMSAEQAIDLRPDVFVVDGGLYKAAKDSGFIEKLDKVGIPTIAIDFFTDPVHNTVPSVQIMGKLLNREQQAKQYIDYWQAGMDNVKQTLARKHAVPVSTFLWRAPGYSDCCATFRDSNLAKLVTFAGGENVGDQLIKGNQGQVAKEALLNKQPDVLIATGANWSEDRSVTSTGFVPLGYAESPDQAQKTYERVIQENDLGDLKAVKNHKSYVVWHHFYDSPYNVIAVQWFAHYIHPDLFPNSDLDSNIKELHQKFLPIEYKGTFQSGN